MFYAVIWAVIGLLVIFWSIAAWGLYSAMQWLSGLVPGKLETATTATGNAAREAATQLGMPEWMTGSIPPEMVEAWLASARALLLWLQSILLEAPALMDWLSPAIWIVWGLGTFLLLLLGIGAHVGLRLFADKRIPTAASVPS